MFKETLRGLKRSLAKYGFIGTVRRSYDFVYWKAWRWTPAGRRENRRSNAATQDFDRAHGVQTGGIVHLSQFQIQDASWIHGNYYEAVDPSLFREALAAAALDDPAKYHFIDFGAGKGRAMLLASKLPFRKIVGIEFSPELADDARRNLASFQAADQRCRDLELLLLDALRYPLPDVPAVLYFYNPFQIPLMTQMVERVEASLRENPRDLYVLYVNPEHDDLWKASEALQPLVQERRFSIYRSRPSQVVVDSTVS